MKRLVVVLGGNSPKNAAWGAQLAKAFGRHAQAHLQAYQHWRQEGAEIDLAAELARLIEYLSTQDGEYCIVAKSAGTLLALQGIAAGRLVPSALVCVGLPISYAAHRRMPLEKLVAANTRPTLYIQATNDPAASAQEVATLTAGHGAFTSIAGDTHDYVDVEALVRLAMEFIDAH